MPTSRLDKQVKQGLFISTVYLFATTGAYSAGFALIENSASGMGKAFSGSAAVAEDATTVWFNPAGMTYLNEKLDGKSQLSSSAHIVSAKTKFTDAGSTFNHPLAGPIPLGGEKDMESRETSLIPNLYYVHPINDNLQFGLAVNGPFGSKTEYEKNWIGRYQATVTDLKTLNINPSLSWKASDKLSLGAGISAQYIKVKLGKSFDSAGACRKVAAQTKLANPTKGAQLEAYCGATYPNLGQTNTDSQAVVKGDDISFGFNVGLLYQPTKKTRLGASYRSQVKHNLSGDATYDIHAGLKPIVAGLEANGINSFSNRDINASVDLPDSLSLSLAHKVNNRLEVLADITRTQWGSFQELKVVDTSGAEVTKTPEKWKNVTRVSLGANYKYNDKLTLRTGVAYDEEPIPSARYRTPRIPGNDRKWLSVGAGYKVNKKVDLDFGYSHLFLNDTPIDNPGDSGYAVKGEYKSHVDILSAQLNYTF